VSAAELSTLVTAIGGAIAAVTALLVTINHILHHDAPSGDGQPPAGGVTRLPPQQ
jgi:hypothetical protein